MDTFPTSNPAAVVTSIAPFLTIHPISHFPKTTYHPALTLVMTKLSILSLYQSLKLPITDYAAAFRGGSRSLGWPDYTNLDPIYPDTSLREYRKQPYPGSLVALRRY